MISLLTKIGPSLAKKTLLTNLVPKNIIITQVEQFNCKLKL